jgi:thioredoxin reductase (NADPH)
MNLFKYVLFIILCSSGIAKADSEIEKIVIIGAGAAGSSAAIFAGQAALKPLVIQDTDYCLAQIALIHGIDNYPGSLDGIEGVELMHKFRMQAEKFGARFVVDTVIEVDLLNKPFRIEFASGKTVYTESIIIASGTTKKWLNLPNEQALRGKGVVSATFCKLANYHGKNVAVIGGGHAALQEAIHMSDTAKHVTLINRSNKFAASIFHQNQAFARPNIEILYNTEVDDVFNIVEGKVTGVQLRNNQTLKTSVKDIDLLVVAIGNKPNTELFANQLELTSAGNIVIKGKNSSTSVPGVFAAGDVTDVAYGRVVIAAGQGAMAALDAARYLDALSSKEK